MDSNNWKLDFDMRILLAHALKTEAGFIRQHFPLARTIIRENGQELTQLDTNLQLLRTGMGLDLSRIAMQVHVDPEKFDLVIHFGVSGSLSKHLPILQIIQGTRFSCHDEPDLTLNHPKILAALNIPSVSFYSSRTAITDKTGRESAKSTGAQAVDMESYAIAQFCDTRDLPLLTIRCISDRAGASTPEDFKKNYSQASRTLQNFIMENVLNLLR